MLLPAPLSYGRALLSSVLLLASLTQSTLGSPSELELEHPLTSQAPYHYVPSLSAYRVTSLTRNVEVGGATTKASSVFTIEAANRPTDDANEWVLALADQTGTGNDQAKLSWLEVTTGRTGATRKPAAVRGLGYDATKRVQFYAVTLPASAASSPEAVTVTTVHLHQSIPKPAFVAQEASGQGLYWESDLLDGAAVLLGVDGIGEGGLKVKVKAPSPKAFQDKSPEGWSVSHPSGSTTITYTNAAPVSPVPQIAAVHYEYPEPILAVTNLTRTMQVSHWANTITIQDDLALINAGPKLKGHFSRLSHQAISYMRRNAANLSPTTVTSINFLLPPRVQAPFFIDEVGNVSTSNFAPSPKLGGVSHLRISPRYPLMGGWNYTFSIGYQQPLDDVLKYDAKQGIYKLAIPFLTSIKGAAFDDVEVKIVLPEGASDVSVATPFPLDSLSDSITYTYLDSTGRPTLIIRKTACSERHARDIYVTYRYGVRGLLQKPIAVASALMGCFVFAGLMRRVEWSIKA